MVDKSIIERLIPYKIYYGLPINCKNNISLQKQFDQCELDNFQNYSLPYYKLVMVY